jgi:uncharacterized oligopeptide transporter (OPT) family protein
MELDQQVVEIIRRASGYSIIVPLLVYLYKARGAPKQNHIIAGLLMLSAVCDIIGDYLFRNKLPTATLSNTYYFFLFVFLCWFYYEILFRNEAKGVFYTGVAIYLISFLVITLFVQGIDQNQSYSWFILDLVILLFVFTYGKYLFKADLFDSNNASTLYFTIGIGIYFSMTLWIFAINQYLLDKDNLEASRVVWAFHNINNITKNLLFAKGLSLTGKKIIDLLK